MATMCTTVVEVISKETIKPSTPTPYLLRNFNLSLLDQYCPPVYVPIILFYPVALPNGIGHDELDLLKRSLSETLVHFYPMAGRMKDNIVVDCNDQGIDFFEVKIKAKMCDFMMKPDARLSLLLPSEVVSMNFVAEAQVIVQVNMFDCGGTAICLCISHKIADACTMSTFIRNWAATTSTARCGGAIITPTKHRNLFPSFDSASLFPPSEQLVSPTGLPPTPVSYPTEDTRKDKLASKRFVFDAVKITSAREKLQVMMNDEYKCHRPTRVEVVSALIWKSVMKSAPACSLSTVNHAVNFRRKMDPPVQDSSFGNLSVVVAAVLPATPETTTTNATSKTVGITCNEVQVVLGELSHFVARLRGEISKVKGNKGCMERIFLTFINGYDASTAKDNDVEDQVIALWMTSWCKFGLYDDADFGWGKPIWVTTDPFIEPNKNIVYMNDTESGYGVEVWVNLLEVDMAKFEVHLSQILELF